MPERRKQHGRPELQTKDDPAIERLVAELKAASEAPLTPEDLAWFESLPEAPPLPTREGETLAIFFRRCPKRPAAGGRG